MRNNSILSESVDKTKTIADIYKQYQAQLKGFIAKRVPSQEDCEDILQDVFYQLTKIDLVKNPIQQISGWLYAVTRNRIIDKSRKNKEVEMPQVSVNEDSDTLIKEISELIVQEDSSPETEYIKSVIWEELKQAMNELPEEQRIVFDLTELQGFSFKEISESTGIPVNTLLSRKRYAVLYLRSRLYDLYVDFMEEE